MLQSLIYGIDGPHKHYNKITLFLHADIYKLKISPQDGGLDNMTCKQMHVCYGANVYLS